MKVLHIIDHAGPGGAQIIVNGILGNRIDYYCYILRKKCGQIISGKRVIAFGNSKRFSLDKLYELRALIIKYNFEIIHCHLFGAFIYGYLLKKIWFHNLKLIFHEHGRIYSNSYIYKRYLRLVYEDVDLFLAVSSTTKDLLMDRAKIPFLKIRVLPNFVDSNRISSHLISDDSSTTRGHDFVLGFAGRLDKVKNVDCLIKAALYLSNIRDMKIFIAGVGPDKERLEDMVLELGLNDKVTFLGYLSDMTVFYKNVDVLIVPSKHESFCLSAREAQCCRIPVIASNVPALNALIRNGENGLLFEYGSPEDLADKIERIYKDATLREELITNGLKAATQCTLDRYLAELDGIYNSLYKGDS